MPAQVVYLAKGIRAPQQDGAAQRQDRFLAQWLDCQPGAVFYASVMNLQVYFTRAEIAGRTSCIDENFYLVCPCFSPSILMLKFSSIHEVRPAISARVK